MLLRRRPPMAGNSDPLAAENPDRKTPSETASPPVPVARQAPGGPSLRRLPPHSLAVPGTGTPGPLSAPRRHRRRGGQSPGTGRGHQGTGRNGAAPEEAAREIDDAIAQLEKRGHAKHRLSDSQEDARFCRVSESTLRDRLNRLTAKGLVGRVGIEPTTP